MSEHILIVDDMKSIRYTAAFVLKEAGYRVSQARDGREALSFILEKRRGGDPVELLVTDVQMPGMSGTDLIRSLHQKNITLPTIVISGSFDSRLVQELVACGCAEMLSKPFSFWGLIRTVKAVLVKQKGEKRPLLPTELVRQGYR
jgi:DNA-binding NtrC family response regulator